jgi:hypothetical protein
LAEHEIMRLITLVTAMAERMGIHMAEDPELVKLAKGIAPEKVLDSLEAQRQQFTAEES